MREKQGAAHPGGQVGPVRPEGAWPADSRPGGRGRPQAEGRTWQRGEAFLVESWGLTGENRRGNCRWAPAYSRTRADSSFTVCDQGPVWPAVTRYPVTLGRPLVAPPGQRPQEHTHLQATRPDCSPRGELRAFQ